MITEEEYSKLVQECLELLRKKELGHIADQLQSIINKPIIEEPDPGSIACKHISEAKERPQTHKEQLQAIVAFFEAHFIHSANSVLRLAEMTGHDPGSIKWMGGEDAEGMDFTGKDLAVDSESLTQIKKHLLILKQTADMPAEPN